MLLLGLFDDWLCLMICLLCGHVGLYKCLVCRFNELVFWLSFGCCAFALCGFDLDCGVLWLIFSLFEFDDVCWIVEFCVVSGFVWVGLIMLKFVAILFCLLC